MRDALRTDDQESYFRILAGVDLLLPVSADVLAGTAPMGWGTWSTGGRTHVLAFTSNAALQACLADYSGSARRVPYSELANTWPNLEWWLAVNPGLPIEGYLPAWFVAQLARGDLRLPTRGPGREANGASKIQELGAAALAASRPGVDSAVGGPTYDSATAGAPRAASAPPAPAAPSASPAPAAVPPSPAPLAAPPVAPAVAPIPPVGTTPPMGPGGLPIRTPSGTSPSGLPVRSPASPAVPAAYQPPAPAAYAPPAVPSADVPRSPAAPPVPPAPAGSHVPPASAAPPVPPLRGNTGSSMATPGWDKPVVPFRPEEDPRGPLQDLRAPLPVRTPLANTPPVPEHVAPYNPAEALVDPNWAGKQSPQPASAPPAPSAPPPVPPAGPVSGGALPRRQPGQSSGGGSMSSMAGFVPAATNAANTGGNATPPPPAIRPASPASGPQSSGFGAPASAPVSGFGGPSAAPVSGLGGPSSTSGAGFGGPPAPSGSGFGGPSSTSGPGFGGSSAAPVSGFGGPAPVSGFGGPGGQQPVSPAAPPPSAPPMPSAAPVPSSAPPAPPLASGPPAAAGPGGPGGALPRRQVTPPSERPPSMAAAAQALGARPPATEQAPPAWDRPASPPAADRFGPSGPAPTITPWPETDSPAATTMTNLLPPVIPGASGAGRGAPYPAGPGYGAAVPTSSAAPTAPALPAPGTSYGLPPQGSPASAYATQSGSAFATQALPVATGGYTPAGATNLGVSGSATGSRGPASEEFVPANDVERELQDAADTGNNDVFLSTLLLAQVMVPVASHSRPGSAPGESGFAFLPEEVGGERFLIVFTSKDRLSQHFGEPTRTVGVRFYELIRNWPDPTWSFAVNPGTPVGAKYPGAQIIALANWATEAGLGSEPVEAPAAETQTAPLPAPEPASDEAQQATVMQKTIAAEQVDYYLDRGYDRVAGFVHRASEVEHLRTPGDLFGALGLYYDSSPFQQDAKEAFVLRWPAYRPSLYRIPYGGQNEQALRAMDGWVIERPPFRGNGFAPGEGRDVIAEFKVDSVRLPHGAQLWSIDADGNERMMAIFDADGPQWRRVGEQ
jgi:hypothetical protein